MIMRRNFRYAIFLLFFFLILPSSSHAQSDEQIAQPGFGDETMLFQEIPSVYGASKYEQKVTEAPSSVSIITSAEISKYGYRTLADVLRSVRSFYVTNDRNYSYLGIRGFDRPGDYNTRILLLVDGHRTNDNIFDQAFIGTDFIVDVDLIDRIEIIRGPGSSLYGSNAFFAVINVITKRGGDLQGVEISGDAGSFQTYKGRLSYGKKFAGDGEVLLSGSAYDSNGQKRMFFKEFDSPQTHNGVAENADGDNFRSFFTKVSYTDFKLSGAYISRDKTIPTAPFGTVFNTTDTSTKDTRAYLDLNYQHSFDYKWEVLARLYYDYYSFDGNYVFAQETPPFLILNKDASRGEWVGSEIKVSTKIQRHNLTLGSEYLRNLKQDQRNFDEEPYTEYLNDKRTSTNWALYFQDEFTVVDKLILNAGVRYDHFNTFGGNTSPRAALIYNPFEKTTLKLLYGEAFRAPNAFEQYYQDGGATSIANLSLRPEKIKTYEMVLDQYLGNHLLFTAAGFYYRINDLITQQKTADDLIQYQNVGTVKAKGLEFELDSHWGGSVEGRASYTYQETKDESGAPLSNSPRHLFKLNVIVPVIKEKVFAGTEVQYTSNRKTLSGNDTGSYAVANMTVFSQKLIKGLSASASIYNIFDKKFGDPGSSEHVQDTIEQDGRAYRFKLTYAF